MESPQHFVDSYIDAWNSHDAPAVAGHLGANGYYLDVPSQQQLAGESLVEHLVDYFSDDHFRYDVIGDVLFNGNTIAFQYRVVPEHPDPGATEWCGAEFIELDGDVARRISDYYKLPGQGSKRAAPGPDGRRYAKSGLSDAAMTRLLDALKTAMEEDKVYLDPELSLPRLADGLGCSVNHLSQAINAGHNLSFFDYINHYRVAEAARLLRQKECRFPAVLDVALSVGFNSISTFYTAFKKSTGQTPARYRRTQPPM